MTAKREAQREAREKARKIEEVAVLLAIHSATMSEDEKATPWQFLEEWYPDCPRRMFRTAIRKLNRYVKDEGHPDHPLLSIVGYVRLIFLLDQAGIDVKGMLPEQLPLETLSDDRA